MELGPWNWLEIAKLAGGLLTPMAIAILGMYVQQVLKEHEHSQWKNQKLIEKRLEIYEMLAPVFNDLLCYFTYVGSWRSQSPDIVVEIKRSLDKQIYIAAPLFSPKFFSSCMIFQDLCFETYTGIGKDARLKTTIWHRKENWDGVWNESWDDCFSSNATDPKKIMEAYREVLHTMSIDVGVYQPAEVPINGNLS